MLYIAVRLRFTYLPSPPSFHFSFSFPPFAIPTLSWAQAILYYKENVYIKHQNYKRPQRQSQKNVCDMYPSLASPLPQPLVNHSPF